MWRTISPKKYLAAFGMNAISHSPFKKGWTNEQMNVCTKYVKSVNKYKHILFFKRFLFFAHLCNICCTFLNLSFFCVLRCRIAWHGALYSIFLIHISHVSCCICWCSSRVILFISFSYMFLLRELMLKHSHWSSRMLDCDLTCVRLCTLTFHIINVSNGSVRQSKGWIA